MISSIVPYLRPTRDRLLFCVNQEILSASVEEIEMKQYLSEGSTLILETMSWFLPSQRSEDVHRAIDWGTFCSATDINGLRIIQLGRDLVNFIADKNYSEPD